MKKFLRICRFLRSEDLLSKEMVNHYIDNPHLLEVIQSMLFPSIQQKIKAFIKLKMQQKKYVDIISIVSHINLRGDIVIDNLTYLIKSGEVKREITGMSGSYILIEPSF